VFLKLLLLFSLVPLLELYVLLRVGALIGTAPTVILILLTGIAGAYLARVQGFDLLQRLQRELAAGKLPATELLDGFLLLVGALLLLTPGFCTDLFGFILLVPQTRACCHRPLQAWLRRLAERGTITTIRR
jgi:UPF0716 protein FxsA